MRTGWLGTHYQQFEEIIHKTLPVLCPTCHQGHPPESWTYHLSSLTNLLETDMAVIILTEYGIIFQRPCTIVSEMYISVENTLTLA
jgi:hypothetical protein